MKNAVSCEHIPMDKLAQMTLMNQNFGAVRIQNSRYSDHYEIDYVDPAPLPSEYEKEIDNRNDESNQHVPRCVAKEARQMEAAVGVVTPLLKEIIAAGRIASRWTRINANKSLYFKIHQLYSTKENSGTTLAVQMNRPRPIPQRYAQKYAKIKEACCTASRMETIRQIIINDLAKRVDNASFQDAVLDLYRDLKGFLTALVAACPWDSYDPFEICAEIYTCDLSCPKHRKARHLLKNKGCTAGQIDAVLSLIAEFKEMEVSNVTA